MKVIYLDVHKDVQHVDVRHVDGHWKLWQSGPELPAVMLNLDNITKMVPKNHIYKI